MVNVTVNRPAGVNIKVNKKDNGEIVPIIGESPTLVNAGIAESQAQFTSLDALSDVSVSTPEEAQLLIYNGSSFENRTVSGDATISSSGVITIDDTAVSALANAQFNSSDNLLQLITTSNETFDVDLTGIVSTTAAYTAANNTISFTRSDANNYNVSISEFGSTITFNDFTTHNGDTFFNNDVDLTDDAQIRIGSDQDFLIFHQSDPVGNFIQSDTSDLFISSSLITLSDLVTVNGSLTVLDNIVSDSIDVSDRITANSLDISSVFTVTPDTISISTNTNISDDVRLKIGANPDLEIYHDSALNRSKIFAAGTGQLYLAGQNVYLGGLAGTTINLKTTHQQGVELNYNSALRLKTTVTGVTANGVVTANSFSGNGNTLTSVDAELLDAEEGGFYRIESAAWAVANNTLTFTRGDANTFDLILTGVANTSSPTFTGNVTVTGDLNILGTTTTIDTSNVLVEDPILLLGKQNDIPLIDFGFYGQRNSTPDGSNYNIAFIWDESEDQFATIKTDDDANNSVLSVLGYSDFRANTITAAAMSLSPNVTITVTGDVDGTATAELTNLNSDANINLRLELEPTGVTPGSYGSASEVPIISVDTEGRVNSISTTSVAGVTDFIFVSANATLEITTADGGFFPTTIDLSSFDTGDLTEGVNQYYTIARANSAIDDRVTKTFVDALAVDATDLDGQNGGFYRIETAAYTVANNTLTFTRGDANTFDLILTGVANTSATVNTSTASASFENSNNTITFTRDDASTFEVTVSGGVTSGALVGNTIILTKSDSTTVDIDLNDLVNDVIVSAAFNSSNNTLTLTQDDGDLFEVDLNAGVSSATLIGNTAIFTRTDASTFDLDLNGLVDDIILSATFTTANNTLSLGQDDGGKVEVDLNAGVSSAAFAESNNTITFTRTDSTTFDVSIHDNTSTTSASFEHTNNTITFTRDDTSTYDVAIHDNTSVSSASYTVANNTLTFARDDNSSFDVILTGVANTTATVNTSTTSASLIGNTAIFTRDDSSTFDLDLNGLVNGIIVNTSWNTSNNTLQLVADDGAVFNNNISQFDANVTFSNTVSVNSVSELSSNSLTTTAVTQVNLDLFTTSEYRTVKYLISVKEGSNYHSTELLLLQDGTNTYITEYAKLVTGSDLATFTADISGSDVRLRVTPASTNSTEFKISRQSVAV